MFMVSPISEYSCPGSGKAKDATPLCDVGGGQGDNDPLDVVEIGSATAKSGGVYKVKPLAGLGLVDDGELDWKIIVINVDDPAAASVNDVHDVERCAII